MRHPALQHSARGAVMDAVQEPAERVQEPGRPAQQGVSRGIEIMRSRELGAAVPAAAASSALAKVVAEAPSSERRDLRGARTSGRGSALSLPGLLERDSYASTALGAVVDRSLNASAAPFTAAC